MGRERYIVAVGEFVLTLSPPAGNADVVSPPFSTPMPIERIYSQYGHFLSFTLLRIVAP